MKRAIPLLLVATLAAAVARGQEATPAGSAPRFEATPFLAYRGGGAFDVEGADGDADVGGHFSFAIALNYRLDEVSQYELFYSRQPTSVSFGAQPGRADLDVEYLLFGGTMTLGESSFLKPYVVGLIGVGRFSLDAPGASDDTRFSISTGVGVRVPVRERLDVRLEARGYLTITDSNTSAFCSSTEAGGTCLLRGTGSSFLQYEFLAGAAFAF